MADDATPIAPTPIAPPQYETDEPVLYEVRGAVAIVSMNRPKFGNAQNNQMTYALDAAFMRAAHDDAIQAIVIKGEGKNFSAGHDMGTPGRDAHVPIEARRSPWYNSTDKPGAEQLYVREQEIYLGMCRRWREIPKPMVAAVHGACIAGGLMIAWISDFILASDDAYFMEPALHMGVPGVEYFAHAFEMSPRIAREFLMLGEKMNAQRAFDVGMVNRVTTREALDEDAIAIAEKLATRPRFAMALAKQALNFVEDLRGKRSAMDGVFAMHHLAHAHNAMTTGTIIGGQTPASMKALNKDQA
ncbi:MAG: enoyl-CoA hydratase [Caulobacter sp.]|nr:enoyl-CoA hydratase [Caulobacter sp.]